MKTEMKTEGEYLGTVEELIDDISTCPGTVIIRDGRRNCAFRPKDVKHLPSELLAKKVKEFRYFPARRYPQLSLLVINV